MCDKFRHFDDGIPFFGEREHLQLDCLKLPGGISA